MVAVEVHEADKGDTSTLPKTLEAARECLGRVTPTPPCPDDSADLVADKGYFSREGLNSLLKNSCLRVAAKSKQTLNGCQLRFGLDFFLRLASKYFEQAARIDFFNTQ
ncbi:hypothetical protein JCM15519_25910 [Fundidesulfovibrio butyratiphilus]